MRKNIKMIILAIVLLFVFCWARDFAIKSLIGTIASSITGAPTRVGGLSLSVMRQSIKISNFRMYNPAGFPKDILVDIPKIRVVSNLGALLTGKIHLKQMELDIKELSMVRNKEGRLNVDSLKITEPKPKEKKAKKPAKHLAMRMDVVTFGMGRVVSIDYSVEGEPIIYVYDINSKKTYKNIGSAQQLALLIISEPLKAAGIQGLKVYAASMITGAAALPVMAAFTFTGKDYTQEIFNVTADRVYDAGLRIIKLIGKVNQENKNTGVISAEVYGAGVTFKLRKLSGRSTEVTISARKMALPRPEIAGGVMYRLHELLK